MGSPCSFIDEGDIITTKEKCGHYDAADKHVYVFGKQIETKFHGGIFLVISHVQFVFSFGKVEWSSVTLRQSTNKKDEKPQWLVNDIPSMVHLLIDDYTHSQRTRDHQNC